MKTRRLIQTAGVVLGLTLGASAYAVSGCTNALLNGSYGMQLSGTSMPAAAASVAGVAVPPSKTGGVTGSAIAPVAGFMRLQADGAGNLAGYSGASIQGAWLQGNVTGSYSVNYDCSAVLTVVDSAGATETFRAVLVNQGRSVLLAQTDTGTGVSGTLRQVHGFCSTSDISGSFGMQYSGTAAGAAFSSTGLLTFDSQGGASATETRITGGSASTVVSSGTITVNPDCSAAISLAAADGSALNLIGLISADETQILVVRSDAGTAMSGLLSAQ